MAGLRPVSASKDLACPSDSEKCTNQMSQGPTWWQESGAPPARWLQCPKVAKKKFDEQQNSKAAKLERNKTNSKRVTKGERTSAGPKQVERQLDLWGLELLLRIVQDLQST